MSDAQTPWHDPNPPEPSGCLSALLIVLGVILLLPGICSVAFMSAGSADPLAAAGLLVSFVGVVLIFGGIGRLSTRQPRPAASMSPTADVKTAAESKGQPDPANSSPTATIQAGPDKLRVLPMFIAL